MIWFPSTRLYAISAVLMCVIAWSHCYQCAQAGELATVDAITESDLVVELMSSLSLPETRASDEHDSSHIVLFGVDLGPLPISASQSATENFEVATANVDEISIVGESIVPRNDTYQLVSKIQIAQSSF